jgi:hypothetical protein
MINLKRIEEAAMKYEGTGPERGRKKRRLQDALVVESSNRGAQKAKLGIAKSQKTASSGWIRQVYRQERREG